MSDVAQVWGSIIGHRQIFLLSCLFCWLPKQGGWNERLQKRAQGVHSRERKHHLCSIDLLSASAGRKWMTQHFCYGKTNFTRNQRPGSATNYCGFCQYALPLWNSSKELNLNLYGPSKSVMTPWSVKNSSLKLSEMKGFLEGYWNDENVRKLDYSNYYSQAWW